MRLTNQRLWMRQMFISILVAFVCLTWAIKAHNLDGLSGHWDTEFLVFVLPLGILNIFVSTQPTVTPVLGYLSISIIGFGIGIALQTFRSWEGWARQLFVGAIILNSCGPIVLFLSIGLLLRVFVGSDS